MFTFLPVFLSRGIAIPRHVGPQISSASDEPHAPGPSIIHRPVHLAMALQELRSQVTKTPSTRGLCRPSATLRSSFQARVCGVQLIIVPAVPELAGPPWIAVVAFDPLIPGGINVDEGLL